MIIGHLKMGLTVKRTGGLVRQMLAQSHAQRLMRTIDHPVHNHEVKVRLALLTQVAQQIKIPISQRVELTQASVTVEL